MVSFASRLHDPHIAESRTTIASRRLYNCAKAETASEIRRQPENCIIRRSLGNMPVSIGTVTGCPRADEKLDGFRGHGMVVVESHCEFILNYPFAIARLNQSRDIVNL